MKKSFKLILVVTAGLFLATVEAKAAVITQWNFNGDSATSVPGGSSSPTPSSGSGTASLVGGATGDSTFGSGTANGGSSDPVATTPTDYAWQTTTYPAQGAASKTAGTQFLVSTVGFEDITVNYDLRHSNTSSRYEQLQYTLNGTTWIDLNLFDGNMGDAWFNTRSGDLTAISAADNNVNFGIRVVSAFDPTSPDPGAYAPSNATSTYAGGTWRFDMVTINGIAVPEPTSVALAAFGVIGLVIGARRKIRSV